MSIREVEQGLQTQGVDEALAYTVTTTNWGSSPTSTSAKIYDTSDDSDKTTTCMTGSTSVAGDVITLPVIDSLAAGTEYRVEVKFTTDSTEWECYFIIQAE